MNAQNDYTEMFNSCILTDNPTKITELKLLCHTAITNAAIYEQVQNVTGIPWIVIAAIHYREADQSFKYHLHNGDPLNARTVHVPAGRPVNGQPPFTWQDSAIDALSNLWHPVSWSLSGMLEFCERYNGLGYMKHGINSPYVWACTDKYVSGLFVADGKLDMTKIDPRPGVAAIFMMLSEIDDSMVDLAKTKAANDLIH